MGLKGQECFRDSSLLTKKPTNSPKKDVINGLRLWASYCNIRIYMPILPSECECLCSYGLKHPIQIMKLHLGLERGHEHGILRFRA